MPDLPRILIVDDESNVQRLLLLTLKAKPWHVEAVSTAEDALQRCKAERYDLLLLDKNLPGMSGSGLLRALRDAGDPVSCLMMTAYSSTESAVEMMSLGVDAYLEKPFENLSDVTERVEEILRLRREGHRRSKGLTQARDHFRKVKETLASMGELPTSNKEILTSMGELPTSHVEEEAALTVVVACPSQVDREFFADRFPNDLVQFVLNAVELEARLYARGMDLIIVDAGVASDALLAFVARIRGLAPEPGFILVSDRLSFNLVTELIDGGVDAIIERPLTELGYAENTRRLLERLRAWHGPTSPSSE